MPRYIILRPGPQSVATDAFQQDRKYQFLYPFPSLSMVERVLRKVQKDQINMITGAWQSQSWYLILLKMTIKNPILLPNYRKLLLSPAGKIHPLIQNSSLRLVAWLVSSKVFLQKGCEKGLSTLSQVLEEQVLSQIMH